MKIAFIATQSESTWAGSEELWWQTARLALARGHQVAVVSFRWPEVPPKIRELQERGALLLQLARLSEWRQSAVLRWLHKLEFERFRVWGPLASWRPDAVCVSQGGTYDVFYNGIFIKFLNKYKFPYIVICQWNKEDMCHIIMPAKSRTVFFREHDMSPSSRNGICASQSVRSPVICLTRLSSATRSIWRILAPVPYPKSDVVKMANVARHNVQCKGQDLLLHALSGESWKQRHWLLRATALAATVPIWSLRSTTTSPARSNSVDT